VFVYIGTHACNSLADLHLGLNWGVGQGQSSRGVSIHWTELLDSKLPFSV